MLFAIKETASQKYVKEPQWGNGDNARTLIDSFLVEKESASVWDSDKVQPFHALGVLKKIFPEEDFEIEVV